MQPKGLTNPVPERYEREFMAALHREDVKSELVGDKEWFDNLASTAAKFLKDRGIPGVLNQPEQAVHQYVRLHQDYMGTIRNVRANREKLLRKAGWSELANSAIWAHLPGQVGTPVRSRNDATGLYDIPDFLRDFGEPEPDDPQATSAG